MKERKIELMQKYQDNKKETWLTIYAYIVILVYMVGLSHFSFSIDDGGYLYGAGWRILIGESIYTDFIYARPPVSPYLNALLQYLMPDNGEYLMMRKFFYLEVFLYSFMSADIIRMFIKDNHSRINTYVLGTVFFIFNVHFNNYMWHTTDGLFFLTLSFWILLKKKSLLWMIISVMSLLLAMGTKQSFYPAVFIFVLFIFAFKGRDEGYKYLFVIVGWATIIALFTYLFWMKEFISFCQLKQENDPIESLIKSGLVVYIVNTAVSFIVAITYLFRKSVIQKFNYFLDDKKGSDALEYFIKLISRSYLFFILLFSFLYSFADFIFPKMVHFFMSGSLILVSMASIYFFLVKENNKESKDRFLVIFVLVSFSWMASLSWGYQTPIFFSGILMYLLLYFGKIDLDIKKTVIFLTLSVFVVFSVLTQRSFFDGKELSPISNKLSGIYSYDKNMTISIFEVNDKLKKCGDSYTIFPDHTYIHYAKSTIPENSLDWISKAEAMNKKDLIQKQIDDSACLIVNERYRFKDKNNEFDWYE